MHCMELYYLSLKHKLYLSLFIHFILVYSQSQPLSPRSALLLLIYSSCQLEALFPLQDFALPLACTQIHTHTVYVFILP